MTPENYEKLRPEAVNWKDVQRQKEENHLLYMIRDLVSLVDNRARIQPGDVVEDFKYYDEKIDTQIGRILGLFDHYNDLILGKIEESITPKTDE